MNIVIPNETEEKAAMNCSQTHYLNYEGEIIAHELCLPFSYLSTLITQKNRENEEGSGSEFVVLGAPQEKDLRD